MRAWLLGYLLTTAGAAWTWGPIALMGAGLLLVLLDFIPDAW